MRPELQEAFDLAAAKLGYYRWLPFVAATRSVGKYSWQEPRLCPIGPNGPVYYLRDRRNGLNPVCGQEGTRGARWLHEAACAAGEALAGKYYAPKEAAVVLNAAAEAAYLASWTRDDHARFVKIEDAVKKAVPGC